MTLQYQNIKHAFTERRAIIHYNKYDILIYSIIIHAVLHFCLEIITRYREKWMSKVAGSRIPPSKQLNIAHVVCYAMYMLWSFAEYARNIISQQHRKIHNFILIPPKFQCKSLHDSCAFTALRGETIQEEVIAASFFHMLYYDTWEVFGGVQFSCYQLNSIF